MVIGPAGGTVADDMADAAARFAAAVFRFFPPAFPTPDVVRPLVAGALTLAAAPHVAEDVIGMESDTGIPEPMGEPIPLPHTPGRGPMRAPGTDVAGCAEPENRAESFIGT